MTQPLPQANFYVEQCIRVVFESCEALYPVDARQNQDVLAANLDCLHDAGLEIIETDLGEDTIAMLAGRESKAYEIAQECVDGTSRLSTGEYGGVHWRVMATTLGDMEHIQLASGDHEEGVRTVARELEALWLLRQQIHQYNDQLNARQQAPDGNDYNALLDLAEVSGTGKTDRSPEKALRALATALGHAEECGALVHLMPHLDNANSVQDLAEALNSALPD
ncbi:hypothetical protein ACSVIJ_04895 [Pseudomonas sp. NCHU5208]|uniref:hypothetical protein n=1 Tax=unclassified Pseudomonas TaxID=196821 RepID=UPI003F9B684B